MSQPVFTAITELLSQELQPVHLQVENESHQHNVPEGSESHFKVVVVCERFAKMKTIARHRLINDTLKELLAGPIHALSIRALSPEEWQKLGGETFASPDCQHKR